MLNRLFGNFLVKKGKITQEQLDHLLPVPKDVKAQVETIAVINKVLTPNLVQTILENNKSFGDTAIEAGYLTEEKLDELLTYQSNTFMQFVQCLLDKKWIALEQINPLLDEFQMLGSFTDAQLSSLIHDDLEQCVRMFVPIKSAQLQSFTLTFIGAFRRLIDPHMYLDKAYTARSLQLDKYACQLLAGDFHLKLYLSAPDNGLLAVANHFANGTYESVDLDALDNVGEFINCVNGLFATDLSYENISVDMNSPEYSLEGPFISNESLYIIPIHANGYDLKAVLEVYE